MRRIAVFASGNGSNFEAIARACRQGVLAAEVVLLVCDRPGARVIGRAEGFGIPTFVFDPKAYGSKEEYEGAIVGRLGEERVELLCLAGYMRLVGRVMLEAYGGRIVNLHPSLLPAFPGRDALGQALAHGVKVFGATIHWVDETLDGGEIIAQRAFGYEGRDRDELEPLLHAVEQELYVETLARLCAGTEHRACRDRIGP